MRCQPRAVRQSRLPTQHCLEESIMARSLQGLVLLSTVMTFAHLPVHGGEGAPNIKRLQSEVQKAERVVAKAQADLARARGRLAQAEGRRDIAVKEFRKVVTYYEDEKKRVLAWLRNVDTDYQGTIDDADLDIAGACADLAEAERKADAWLRELHNVVVLHERKLQRYQKLLDRRAVDPREVTAVRRELEVARKRLDAARKSVEGWP